MKVQIPQISAEMLLSYLYPELEEKWIAHHEGTFYRNYNRDILSLSEEDAQVWLSRDSILSLLPQGLLSMEEDLKKGDWVEKHKELEMQLKILSDAFLPIDTFSFRRLLKIERQVSELLEDKLAYILRTYCGFDLDAEQNPYVREVAVLLPFVRHKRGDLGFVKNLLESVFHCQVTMQERRYSHIDSTLCWIPVVRYELLIPDLQAEGYRALMDDIKPLTDFLSEWFLPMEVRLEVLIKQHGVAPEIGAPLTLDYNTEL